MLKKWLVRVAYAFLALFVLFDLSLFVPVFGEICAKDEYTGAKDCAQHHIGPYLLFGITKIIDEHNGIVTAIATVLLAFITYRLVQLGRDQSATERAELRAYVGVEEIFVEAPNLSNPNFDLPNPIPGGFIFQDVIRIRLRNFGKTPASEVAVFLNWHPTAFSAVFPRGVVLPIYYTAQDIAEGSRYILDPSASFLSTVVIKPTLAIFRRAQARQISIYFYGHIEYTDGFARKWRRNFRYIWEPWRHRQDQIVPAPDGNNEEQVA